MQHRVKRLFKFFRTRSFQSDPAITQIQHASGAFDSFANQRIGACGRKGNALPASALRSDVSWRRGAGGGSAEGFAEATGSLLPGIAGRVLAEAVGEGPEELAPFFS